MVPSSSRANGSNVDLSTGGISISTIGGFSPAELKFAGYDDLRISGRADSPVYLYIHKEEVGILDASYLWGRDTWEAESAIKKRHQDPLLRIACIGPSGENCIRLACIIQSARLSSKGQDTAVHRLQVLPARLFVQSCRSLRSFHFENGGDPRKLDRRNHSSLFALLPRMHLNVQAALCEVCRFRTLRI
jgi:hypothetical protein